MAAYIGAFVIGTFLVTSRAYDDQTLGRDVGNEDEAFASTEGERGARLTNGYRKAAVVLFTITFIFLVLRMYDLFFVRGFLSAESIQAFRNSENNFTGADRSSSGISFITGIGYPIAIPAFIFTIAFRRYLTKRMQWTGYGLFAFYGIYVNLSGNRYILLGPMFEAVVCLAIANGRLLITKKSMVIVGIVASIIFGFLTLGTMQRDLLFGATTREEAVAVSPERKLYVPSPGFVLWFHEQPEIVQNLLWSYVDIAWYNTHGMFEWQKTYDYANPEELAWGTCQYATATYFFRILGITIKDEDKWRRNVPTYGFYSTFFGPAYLDFGVAWGLIYLLALGVIAQHMWVLTLRGKLIGTLLYPYVASVVYNMADNNLIQAGLGIPIMAVTVMAAIIIRLNAKRENLNISGNSPASITSQPTVPAN